MSSSDSLASKYVSSGDGDPSIDWAGLGQLLAGTSLAAMSFFGIRIYRAILGGIAYFFGWVGDTFAGLYSAVWFGLITLVKAAFATATASIRSLGLLAPPVGIAIALVTVWIWMRDQ